MNLRNVCRAKAIQNAKIKAESMTKPLMQSIGNAIHIQDTEYEVSNMVSGRVAGIQIRGVNSLNEVVEGTPKIEFEKKNRITGPCEVCIEIKNTAVFDA